MKNIEYEKKYSEQLKQNLNHFDIKNEDILQKIRKFCEKFNFNFQDVKTSIKNNNFLKAWFISEPLKQNFYEKIFGKFLKKQINGIIKVQQPKNLFIMEQQIITKKEVNHFISLKSKSIDFSFKYKDLATTFYVFHKYTKERGGSQDNQKNDIKIAIEGAKTNTNKYNQKIMVLFICDGPYYNQTRIQELKNIATQDNLQILSSDQLSLFLDDFYSKNKKNNRSDASSVFFNL